MDNDQRRITLLLHGFTVTRFRHGQLYGWGIRHSQYGDLREDFFNREHGPTVAPLVWYSPTEGTTSAGDEISFSEIPDYTLMRLWNHALVQGWV